MDLFSFSKKEIKEITISTIVLALAFSGFFRTFSIAGFLQALFILVFVFIFHELGHRTVARKFGAHAEYRMWNFGLVLALISSFFGFIFAAPGAVYISPVVRKGFAWTVHRLSQKEYGIIALSGPAINLALGAAFYAAYVFAPAYTALFFLAAKISFFLALFNLIPFPPLDGQKVMRWDWKIWLMAIIASFMGYYLIA